MKIFITFLLFTSLFISCGQSTNSNTYDEFLDFAIDPSNVNLVQAFSVINQKCLNCHTGYHNAWKGFNTDELWIASGVVTPQSASSSALMLKLKNDGGNMPLGGANLTSDEYDALKNWIEAL